MLQAASVSVPDTLSPRFCLSWLPAPLALSLRREVLVEFCILALPLSPYVSLTLYVMNHRWMGSLLNLASLILSFAEILRNYSQTGATSGFKCRHVLLTENLRGRINYICMCKHHFKLVVLS